jgi:heat shock protein HtpX
MALLQGVVNAFVMFLARILAFAFSSLGKDRENSSSGSYLGYTLLVMAFEVVFMVLGSLVVAWFSRYREFRADRGGAYLAGKSKMIAALEALQRLHPQQDPRSAKPSFNALKISSKDKQGFLHLFSSHPPLALRIQKLKESL